MQIAPLLLTLTVVQGGAIERTGSFERLSLRESSGVALSHALPGVLWTHQDSGDGPYLYATNLDGRDLGRFRVTGAQAEDWEDVALGPCPWDEARSCLFIADTGDNEERRETASVYAVPEPRSVGGSDASNATAQARQLEYRYQNGPRDVEAMFVAGDGSIHLFTKGRSQEVEHYTLSAAAWSKRLPLARLVGELPIGSRMTFGRWVTGAALAPSGQRVAIRTYSEVYVFGFDGARLSEEPLSVCSVAAAEPQGEAVDFLNESFLVLTSEAGLRGRAPIHRVRCGAS